MRMRVGDSGNKRIKGGDSSKGRIRSEKLLSQGGKKNFMSGREKNLTEEIGLEQM